MPVEVHKDDVGTVFELTLKDDGTVVDISSQTLLEIIFEKPDGTTVTKTASLTNTGTDGKMQYKTVAADLDVAGLWKLQGKITIAAGTFRTSEYEFRVYEIL